MKLHPIAKSVYDHPDKWSVGEILYPSSCFIGWSIRVDVSRGFLFVDYPDTTLIEKWQIMKAAKWLRKKKMQEALEKLGML